MSKESQPAPGHHINRISRLSTRWLEPRLEKLGLAVAQIPVMGAIGAHGSLSQKELARMLYVEQPTMAQLLARMERDGLIERKPDPNDGRSTQITLTSKALGSVEKAGEVLMEGREIALRGFSDTEIEALDTLVQRMRRNLEEALDQEIK